MSEPMPLPPEQGTEKKKFLGVHFRCCNLYQRIYCNRSSTAYEGRCPRCGRTVKISIGEGGVDTRFFEAY